MTRLQTLVLAYVWLFCQLVSGAFDINAKNNVAVYYGQGPNQIDLINYCKQPSIDIIVLAFVHVAPAQGNGLPGTNFGNQCGEEVYPNSRLLSNCTRLAQQIPECQSKYGKKVLLSIGGGVGAYGLNGAADGKNFADLLWAIFGPVQPGSNKPRPFGQTVIDGFDLDIEAKSDGYVDFARQLRENFKSAGNKSFLLTAAPQCPVPDLNVGDIISAVQIDALFLQFYNTPYCSARAWVDGNKNYKPGMQANQAGFTFVDWVNWLQNTASKNTRIYIGLPGGPTAVENQQQYVEPSGAASLLQAHYCHPMMGGLAIWDATRADNVVDGKKFYESMKQVLSDAGNNPQLKQCAASASGTSKPASGTTYTTKPASSSSTSKPTSGAATSKPPTTLISTTAKPSSTAATSSARASAVPSSAAPGGGVSDGSCGPNKPKCPAGSCCSKYNFCGTTPDYCGAGCLPAFGTCTNTSGGAGGTGGTGGTSQSLAVSKDGSCGPGVATCKGNTGGQCCSQWGYCGSSSAHCGTGCKKDFGVCA